ncbi:hypothetical protein E4U41_004144 [Claviceps citrina]|nr:hypothetical protein E4U41_004144 [Claviceps citrina]
MQDEAFLRHKCNTYKISLKLAKTTNAKLKEELSTERAALAEKDARVASLTAQVSHLQRDLLVHESRCAALEDQVRTSESQVEAERDEALRLGFEIKQKTYQARVYKTALKAAFKLPGVETQATYRSMLEITQRQLRKSLDQLLAEGPEMRTLAPILEDSVPVEFINPETPQTPRQKKKRRVDNPDSDPDDAPAAKMRSLTPRRSPRKILRDARAGDGASS